MDKKPTFFACGLVAIASVGWACNHPASSTDTDASAHNLADVSKGYWVVDRTIDLAAYQKRIEAGQKEQQEKLKALFDQLGDKKYVPDDLVSPLPPSGVPAELQMGFAQFTELARNPPALIELLYELEKRVLLTAQKSQVKPINAFLDLVKEKLTQEEFSAIVQAKRLQSVEKQLPGYEEVWALNQQVFQSAQLFIDSNPWKPSATHHPMIHIFPFVAHMIHKEQHPALYSGIPIGRYYKLLGHDDLRYVPSSDNDRASSRMDPNAPWASVWDAYYDNVTRTEISMTISVARPETLGQIIRDYIPGLFFDDPYNDPGSCRSVDLALKFGGGGVFTIRACNVPHAAAASPAV